jgi:phosphoglycolate phosphatase
MREAPPPDGAVFDFDGVIVDSRVPVRTAVNEALAAHGFARHSPAELDRFIGPPVLAALAELTGESEDSAAVAACAVTYHREYERVYLTQTTLVEGIVAVLDALEIPLALATAKQVEFTMPLLVALGLGSRFKTVCAADNSAPHERKATIVERALRGLAVGRAVVVGDRSFDVEAAIENGVPPIGVTWGIGDRAELERAGADVIVERPRELLGLLGKRSGYGA